MTRTNGFRIGGKALLALVAGVLAMGGLALGILGATATGVSAQSRLDRLIDSCRGYADDAVRLNRLNRRRNCGLTGTRWSSNRVNHFRWCVSVPGSLRQREASARRAELRRCRPGPRPGFCTREYRPVCAVRDGDRNTYSNACEARRARARIIRQGPCRSRPDPGPGGGRNCRLREAKISVSTQNCSPKTLRIPFGRRVLRHGESVRKTVNSGTIGRGHGPWGVCNFHTTIQYACRNGRLRIQRVFVCQQARTNRTSATCRVSN